MSEDEAIKFYPTLIKGRGERSLRAALTYPTVCEKKKTFLNRSFTLGLRSVCVSKKPR